MAKGGLLVDTPLKPWTRISAPLIGCESSTDNTCLTPSSKLTPGALRNIGNIPSSSCIQSHSCPIRHRVAAAPTTDPGWTLARSHRRILAGNRGEMLVKLAVALLVLSVLEQVVGLDNIDFHDSPPEKPVSQKGRLSLQNTGNSVITACGMVAAAQLLWDLWVGFVRTRVSVAAN